uniref:Uncharacterized protein n=1 Tax=Sphaeramia orbicularis TaxID=375764 RepID=A0A673ADL2_9TELE
KHAVILETLVVTSLSFCLSVCLQGNKLNEPCAGLDCSGGCRCNPEKGSRVSQYSRRNDKPQT